MTRRQPREVYEVSEEALQKMVRVLGETTAAALALADLKRRREKGESPRCYWVGERLIVGPEIEP
jgi:hypothetical protein